MKVSKLILSTVAIYISATTVHSDASDSAPFDAGDCTIGVFSGSVTSDGKPLLWKNRDVFDSNQRFIFVDTYFRDGIYTIPYTGNVYSSDSTKVYMGANLAGFAIINSDSYNLGDSLETGVEDGDLMRVALETCRSLDDFEEVLDSTGNLGRINCWNFGVLDSSGNCAMFECGNYSHIRLVPSINEPLAFGFIIRANFSASGGEPRTGLYRYKRARELAEDRLLNEMIDEEFILGKMVRDLGNEYDIPYPLPYMRSQAGGPSGYIYNYYATISNSRTTSASVIKGVNPGENPALTTIYAMVGSPDLSLAFPLWVGARNVPVYISMPDSTPVYCYCKARKSRLYDDNGGFFFINSKKLYDEFGDGIYSYTLPLESWGIEQADMLVDSWSVNLPVAQEMAVGQLNIASALFAGFQRESADNILGNNYSEALLPGKILLYNYPNPFNGHTRILFELPAEYPYFNIRIFDSLGRFVKEFAGTEFAGNYVVWQGDDKKGEAVVSGVYYYTLTAGPYKQKNKMVLLK